MNRKIILATALATLVSVPALAQDQQQDQRVIIGKVTAAKDVKLKGVVGNGHRLVRLENDKGKSIVVDLGLMENLPKDMAVYEGDHLMVIGKNARINGKPVIYAQWAGELHSVGHTGRQQQQ